MAIGPGLPGATMEAFAEGFACGQTGILTVTIDDGDANNVLPQTTAGILEIECGDDGFAVYRYLGVYPSDPSLSPYVITWEGASGTDPLIDTTATEEIFVSEELIAVPSGDGPCTDWLTEEDVLACCDVEASSGVIFTDAIQSAQNLLFQLSGRKYAGLCGPLTVRPCRDNCSCFPAQRLAYASGGSRLIWTGGWWGWGGDSSRNCGCGCLSQVKLSGFPVQIITEVKINGEIVPPSSYRLDENRYLTRVDGSFWPSCQDLALADTEEGTFSVSYGYGASPPPEGVAAAAQLACEIYKSCASATGTEVGDCLLPTGATRITRQGITIERQFFQIDPATKSWRTGMAAVDMFLNAHNPHGLMRRPTFWAPGRRYARPVG